MISTGNSIRHKCVNFLQLYLNHDWLSDYSCVTQGKLVSGTSKGLISNIIKVSERDQEIPQSHTADQPTAPRGRTQNIYSNKTFTRQYKQSNQRSLPLPYDCITRRTQSNVNAGIWQGGGTEKIENQDFGPEKQRNTPISSTADRGFRFFCPFEMILSHIPTHTRSSDPYVSSLSEKSVPHRYPCEISVTNTR